MLTQLIHGDKAFETLADEWNELVQKSMTNTPFQLLAYQQGWWHYLHPSQATLHTVAVREEDSRALLAIGCFYLTEANILYFNGCVEETDYLDLITTPEQADAVWDAVFACICSNEFPTWRSLDFCNVPEASPTRSILPKLAQERGFLLQESVQEVCPVITLPDTFDAYLDNIDSKQRREIKRKLRRASGANAQLVRVQSGDDIEAAVDTFLELLQKSTFDKRDWLTEARRALFHTTATTALEAGMLELLFMEVDGEKAAALFNFDYEGRIWVYNSGLDSTQFGNLSLGVVLTAKAIEQAIENGRSAFDFLRGNETYKYRFGAKDTHIYRLQIGKT